MRKGLSWAEREELARQMLHDGQRIDMARLQEVRDSTGMPIQELVAQPSYNDPFYAGTPAQLEKAEWLAEMYQQHGRTVTHIRMFHYRLVSLQVPKWDGVIYQNSERDAAMIYDVATDARYLDLIPIDAFEDHRNDAPLLNFPGEVEEPELEVRAYEWDRLEVPEKPHVPEYKLLWELEGTASLQRYRLEIWCEKTTINTILEPLARQYHLTVQTAAGQMSLSVVYKMLERSLRHGRAVRIFYISDFDPSGQTMPVAMAVKVAICLQKMRERGVDVEDVDIKLFTIALTAAQVAHYQLPRIPIKDTDRSKSHFEQTHGEDAVELDALEALHPGELRKIILAAIKNYHDSTLGEQLQEWQQAVSNGYTEVQDEVYQQFQVKIDALDEQYDEIEETMKPLLDAYNQEHEKLVEQIKGALEECEPDMDDYPLPEGEERQEIGDPLYSSNRGYYDQVVAFKKFQGKYDSQYGKKGEVGIGFRKAQEQVKLLQEQQAVMIAEQQQVRLTEIITLLQDISLSRLERGRLLLEAMPLIPSKQKMAFYEQLPFDQAQASRAMQIAREDSA